MGIQKRSKGMEAAARSITGNKKVGKKATVAQIQSIPPDPNAPKKNGKVIDARDRFGKKKDEMVKGKIPKYKQKFIDKQLKEPSPTTGGEKFDTTGLDTSRLKPYQKLTKELKPKKGEVIDDNYKYNVSEEGLRDWFGKSSGTTKSGRRVRGWVQVGGKYDGKPCARQPGQKSTPKCVSSSKRRSMSDKERDSAARRKRKADPNQPQKSGAAKPTMVSTDPKKKMKENYFNRKKVVDEAALTAGTLGTAAALGAAGGTASAIAQNLTNKVMKNRSKKKKVLGEMGLLGPFPKSSKTTKVTPKKKNSFNPIKK